MNKINTERNPPENKDASIKSDDDPVRKILAKLEQKEDIHNLKIEIQSLREQFKGSNNSHAGPTHNVVPKAKINLPRFDGKNN